MKGRIFRRFECRYHRDPRIFQDGEHRDNRQSPSETRDEMLSRVCARHSSIFHFKSSFTTCLTQSYLPRDVPEIFRPRCGSDRRSDRYGRLRETQDHPSIGRYHYSRYSFPAIQDAFSVVPRHLRSLSSRRYSGTGYGVKPLTALRVSLASTPFVKSALNHCRAALADHSESSSLLNRGSM